MRIFRIIEIINTIGMIGIISKILPERQPIPRHQRPPLSLYRARHYCPQLIPLCHTICQFNVAAPALVHLSPKIWQYIYGLCNISTPLFPCGQWNSTACLQLMIISKPNAAKLSWIQYLVKLLPGLESQGTLGFRLSKPIPSPRRVIESHTQPILQVAVVAVLGAMGGGEGLESARKSMVPGDRTCRLHSVTVCVTDELLTHHWGAAFPYMMTSLFPISTCHKPTCDVSAWTEASGYSLLDVDFAFLSTAPGWRREVRSAWTEAAAYAMLDGDERGLRLLEYCPRLAAGRELDFDLDGRGHLRLGPLLHRVERILPKDTPPRYSFPSPLACLPILPAPIEGPIPHTQRHTH